MNAIAAVDKNFAIGSKGELLIHIPDDLKRFRAITSGKVVVYGRKTLETFPGKTPLKNRTNIVLSRDETYRCDGAIICHSVSELQEVLRAYDDDEVFCIGGETVYSQLFPYYHRIYLTHIDREFPGADAFFPVLSQEWTATKDSGELVFEDVKYRFVDYEKG